MREARQIDGLADLNKQIAEVDKEISNLQAHRAALQHRKGQYYIEEEKGPETALKVVHRPKILESENVGADWVAEFVHKSAYTVRRWASQGKIPHTKCGRRLVFSRQEIIDWWQGFKVETKEAKRKAALRRLAD